MIQLAVSLWGYMMQFALGPEAPSDEPETQKGETADAIGFRIEQDEDEDEGSNE